MKYGLSSETIEKMNQVFSNHINISKVMLYGSRAKGNFREGSDIDLTLFGEDIDIKELHTIELEIDDLLLPYKVDLSIFDRLKNEALREHIQRVGVVFYGKSMREWREVKLEEIVSKLGDGLHGTPKYDDTGEYFFINGNNLSNGKILIKDNTKRANLEEYKKYKKILNDRTIFVSINGTLGNIALYNNEKCILGKSACYFNINTDVNKFFIRYVVTNRDFQEYIENFATGTTIPNVSLKTMREYTFKLPPLKEQKAIAEVLSSLDDKIDLLYRQNKTLEELAKTLFRQWFIEEAKDEWEECKLSDKLEIKYGKDHKKLADGNIPVYGSGGIMRYADSFLYDKESILIPRKGTLTNLFYIDEPFWTVDTIFWSKVNTEKVSGKFLFSFLKTMDLSNLNVGSAVPSLTTKVLNEIKILLPSLEEQKEFNEYADSAWEKMGKNKIQIKTLENMRDTLLPKLMSGEVRVKI